MQQRRRLVGGGESGFSASRRAAFVFISSRTSDGATPFITISISFLRLTSMRSISRLAGCPRNTRRRSQPSLHCHLRSTLPFPCQLPRECLASRLPSERANEHAERLIAMIARRTAWRSASNSTIALLSRPDHDACLPVHGASLDLKR
jgi:hypothetical protein